MDRMAYFLDNKKMHGLVHSLRILHQFLQRQTYMRNMSALQNHSCNTSQTYKLEKLHDQIIFYFKKHTNTSINFEYKISRISRI